MPRRRAGEWPIALAVGVAAILAFLPALGADFVTWDDDRNFTGNPDYRGLGWAQLRWMWTTFHMGHYVPLSWMTLGLDYTLWGMNPAGYHLTNLLFHGANAVLVYFLARRLLVIAGAVDAGGSGPAQILPPALAALLFAVHPLRVESVAWVTERRDVVSLFFYLLAILCYLRAAAASHAPRRDYWASVALFVAALLSKATSVSLPAILLLLDVYPLRRIGGALGWRGRQATRVYLELVPFAVLAAAASLLSIVALHPPDQLSLAAKLAVSAYSLGFYLWKTVVPTGLSPLYEMPQHVQPLAARYVVGYVAAAISVATIVASWRRWPAAAIAGAAFLVVTLPMLGIVQNGPQIAADRYTYHAAPALTIAIAALAVRRRRLRIAPAVFLAGAVVVLAVLTWRQTGFWRDSRSLWSRVVAIDDRSSIGQVGFARSLYEQGRVDEAIEHYVKALAIDPKYPEGYNNLGVALARRGRRAEAIECFQRAVALKPGYAEAHSNWGAALDPSTNLDSAIAHFRAALAIDPRLADAHANWGNSLVRAGQPAAALEHYERAVALRPEFAEAELNWGVALARQGRIGDAIAHFQRAVALKPSDDEAQRYLERARQLLRP